MLCVGRGLQANPVIESETEILKEESGKGLQPTDMSSFLGELQIETTPGRVVTQSKVYFRK